MHLHPSADKEANALSRALGELAIDNCQNIPLAARNDSDPKFIKAQIEQHIPRLQRPALSAQTFEPLAALDENSDATFAVQGMIDGPSRGVVAFTDSLQLQIAPPARLLQTPPPLSPLCKTKFRSILQVSLNG